MFAVDEPTAEAIRRAWQEGGELSGMIEFQRHFPLISNTANAQLCMRAILSWAPELSPAEQRTRRRKRSAPERKPTLI